MILSNVKIYAKLANAAGLKKEFIEATKRTFDPLTGELTTFENVVTQSAKRLKTVFKDFIDTIRHIKFSDITDIVVLPGEGGFEPEIKLDIR